MSLMRFFFGGGWLTAWYLLFYAAAVIPGLLFLAFLRLGARTRGGGVSEGVTLSYAISSMLLSIVTILNMVLGAAGVPFGGALKYPLALLAAVAILSLYWAWTSHALGAGARSRRSVAGIHLAVTLLLLLNLCSLWAFQTRPRPAAAGAELASAVTAPLRRAP